MPIENGIWQALGIDAFLKFVGGFLIIAGIAYWFYIWPDELHSGKEKAEEDLAIGRDEPGVSSQDKDLENIYHAGAYYGLTNRSYFGGIDRRQNPPKEE